MRSPGNRAAPRHRAPSAAARARADAAPEQGADGAPPGPREVRAEPGDALAGPGGRRRRDKARPGRSRPGAVRISPALRRLVVTPTFAAGLGVVVAAFLAANMSRTVLHFSAPIPGNQCPAGDCRTPEPHGGALASARPGVPIKPSEPAVSGPATTVRTRVSPPNVTASGAGGSDSPQPSVSSRSLSISYEQVGQWAGGFADRITIRGLSGTRAQAWSLSFSFPGARIAGVQGARWEPGRPGAGVAQGVAWPGWGHAQGAADGVRLMVIVEGQPAPPSGCSFDGDLCTFAPPGPG